jgi:hypothetical protein
VSDRPVREASAAESQKHLKTLAILAALSTCVYGLIACLSYQFGFDSPAIQRPIVSILLLFAATFIAYLFAIRIATRARQDRSLLVLIICSAIVFRVVLLFSVPIQEVDIYRYLWDGAVSTTGVSPFRFSPDQIRKAAAGSTTDEDLRAVIKLLDHDALVEILGRVHYGELPTIYPPVSQIVFAAAALTTPVNSSLDVHVFVMKVWLVGFDLATLLLVVGLLRLCGKPIGLCLIYAWCPLLLKEVANSGHLDAITVFLTTLAIYLAAKLLSRFNRTSAASRSTIMYGSAVAFALALATGAKLYPVVLAPLLLLVFIKRIGWVKSLIPAIVYISATLLFLWPLLPRESASQSFTPEANAGNAVAMPSEAPPIVSSIRDSDPSLGVTTFLRRWEMNDFIFLVLFENLKPASQRSPGRTAWFSVVPDVVRRGLVAYVVERSDIADFEVPFLFARAITAFAFLSLAIWFAWQAAQANDAASFCNAGFLTLAWFWLLCPTQNPWYWTWALPLLPFARSRVWLAVSGLAMLYYFRFWLSYHFPDTSVLGTGYTGATFFDLVVTWIEYGPWFICLATTMYWRRTEALSASE